MLFRPTSNTIQKIYSALAHLKTDVEIILIYCTVPETKEIVLTEKETTTKIL